eukprot:scaffold17793_cov131-Isochrysis_galbana.AAC.11
MRVWALPPSESHSNLVRHDSRYGTCIPAGRAEWERVLMTCPSAKSDLLIWPASFKPPPVDCDMRTFSDPARSRSERRPYRAGVVAPSSVTSRYTEKTACEREECWLSWWCREARRSRPRLITYSRSARPRHWTTARSST